MWGDINEISYFNSDIDTVADLRIWLENIFSENETKPYVEEKNNFLGPPPSTETKVITQDMSLQPSAPRSRSRSHGSIYRNKPHQIYNPPEKIPEHRRMHSQYGSQFFERKKFGSIL